MLLVFMMMIGLLEMLWKCLSSTMKYMSNSCKRMKNVFGGPLKMINVGFLCSTAWDMFSLYWFKEIMHVPIQFQIYLEYDRFNLMINSQIINTLINLTYMYIKFQLYFQYFIETLKKKISKAFNIFPFFIGNDLYFHRNFYLRNNITSFYMKRHFTAILTTVAFYTYL